MIINDGHNNNNNNNSESPGDTARHGEACHGQGFAGDSGPVTRRRATCSRSSVARQAAFSAGEHRLKK